MINRTLLNEALVCAIAAVRVAGIATARAAETYRMTTPIPPGNAPPNKVETRLGPLNFFYGFLDKASVERLFENLDFQRAMQAYLLAIPAVSQGLEDTGKFVNTL